jgi:hypothetical protein
MVSILELWFDGPAPFLLKDSFINPYQYLPSPENDRLIGWFAIKKASDFSRFNCGFSL